MLTVSDFKTDFPEFEETDNTVVTRFIGKAEIRVNRTEWGVKADDGVGYLTAHLLKRFEQGDGAASGPVASERVGDIAVSYGVSDDFKNRELASTVYGRQYLDLCGEVFASRVV